MASDTRVPVVGVFYSETAHFADWLASVWMQRGAGIEPVPVIVVSHHPDYASELTACIERAIEDGQLERANTHVLPENVGPTRAFNKGVEQFIQRPDDWPWIASLDPDARFAPDAIRELISSCKDKGAGMASPLILAPRPNGDFRARIHETEIVCQAGHFPFFPIANGHPLQNYWRSHFRKRTVRSVREFLGTHPGFAPFTPCFCASVWKTQMFSDIGVPHSRQLRTLNCGEIGYRAQLRGWRGALSSNSIAFHPQISGADYLAESAIANRGCTAWHYFHAQALIALQYFPDDFRNQAVKREGIWMPWTTFFPDLHDIDPVCENRTRQDTFDRWDEFCQELRPGVMQAH